MEITIKINGRMTVVEVSAEVADCMDAAGKFRVPGRSNPAKGLCFF